MLHSSVRPPFFRRFISALVASAAMVLFTATVHAADESITGLPQYVVDQFGEPPTVPTGPLDDDLKQAVREVFVNSLDTDSWGRDQNTSLAIIDRSEDPRLAWLVADLMRFVSPDLGRVLSSVAGNLLNIEINTSNYWGTTTDHLIAWDIPAPPDYLETKRHIFTSSVPGWEGIFTPGDIDWRHVSWGGVLIDDRAFDKTREVCNCIPAADDPEVTSAEEANWLSDDDIVFGIEVNGEYRAYPRQIMEVREMVNDTLGGRDLGIPYCTLCLAAQAYFTDDVPDGVERPILRTSGLLIRSNKVMYDLNTRSVFDTFLGKAVTGELAKKNVQLKQASVVTTDWGTWKKQHPETTVLAEELALGRDFNFREGRDADGPIFPVGNVDPRLWVHEEIIGVVTESGTPVAFLVTQAYTALSRGETLEVENIKLELDAGGVRAINKKDGSDAGSHTAFWFAWSQFYPETKLWPQI